MKAMVSKKANQRILAAIMACVMLFSLIYTSSPSAAETETHKNCITVSVVDEDGKAVEGARVEYSISSKQEGKVKSDIATTDGSGVVEVFSTTEYEKYPEGDLSVSAEVTKTGYEGAVLAGDVTSGTHDFQMTIKENKITGVVIKPNDLKYNGSEQELVSVTGTKEGDKVSYKLGDGEFSTEVPKATEIGTYNVSVKVEREGYPEYEKDVAVSIEAGVLTDDDITFKAYSGDYDGVAHASVIKTGGKLDDGKNIITYEYDGKTYNEAPAFTDAGEYSVKVIVNRTNYEQYEKTLIANINSVAIDGITVEPKTGLKYTGSSQALVTVSGVPSDATVKYEVTDPKGNKGDENKGNEVGTYSVKVTVVSNNKNYKDLDLKPVTVAIAKAERTIKFKNYDNTDVLEVEFDSTNIATPIDPEKFDYKFWAETNQVDGGKISYKVENNAEGDLTDIKNIASIDEEGNLLIKKGGYIIKVTATIEATDHYEEATITKEVVIKEKSSPVLTVNCDGTYVLGTSNGVIATIEKNENDNGEITLGDTIEELELVNDTIRVKDNAYKSLIEELEKAENNELSVTLQVKQSEGKKTSASDKNTYVVYSATKPVTETVKIKFADVPNGKKITDLYEIYGEKVDKNSNWYTGNVTVTAKETYDLSKYDENDLSFEKTIMYDENTKDGNYSVVFKSNNGGILKPIKLLQIDKKAPEMSVEYVGYVSCTNAIRVADSVVQKIKYYYGGKSNKNTGKDNEIKPVKVKLSAKDDASKVAEFEYEYTIDGNAYTGMISLKDDINTNNANNEGKLSINKIDKDENTVQVICTLDLTTDEVNGYFGAKAVDNAGNESAFKNKDGGEYIYDNVAPDMTIIKWDYIGKAPEGQEMCHKEVDGTLYFNSESVGCTLKIDETNFDKEDVIINLDESDIKIENNGEKDDKEYKSWQPSGENGGTFTFNISGERTHKLKITYTDKSGNIAETIERNIVIDRKEPRINCTYKGYPGTTESKDFTLRYYQAGPTVGFDINDENFADNADVVKVEWNGTVVSNKVYSVKHIKGDPEYEVELPDIAGAYVVTIENKDKCGNRTSFTTDTIVVDTVDPEISIRYLDENENETTINPSLAEIYIDEINFDKDNTEIWLLKETYKENAERKEEYKGEKPGEKITGGIWGEVTGVPVDVVYNQTKSAATQKNCYEVKLDDLELNAKCTFFVKTTDKSGRESDLNSDFIFDTTKPYDLGISYSKISDSTAYYNSTAQVELSATDVASGVKEFNYTLVKRPGSSNVNRGTSKGTIKAKYNRDNKFVATIEIPAQFDGYVDFEAVDYADNSSDTYDGSAHHIVVDNKAPTSSVTFNTPVQNVGGTSYYDGNITATININEANFNARNITVSVTKDGVNYPVSTSWSGSGDSHTGIVTLSEDGDYNVSIKGTDEANNSMTPYTSENLTIDTDITEPVITVNGLEADGKAFKDKVVPAVKFEDTNLESYEITLLRTRYGEKNVDVTEEFIKNHMSVDMNTGVGEGEFDEFAKIQGNDGIYTLKAVINDKAGHESEKEIVFTVNRYGSIYVYDDYLVDLIADGGAYVQSIDKDLIITEYNPDKLVSQSLNVEISKDGKPLEIAAPAISPEINDRVTTGSSGWYQYQYTISKDNFAADGIYKIVVSSKDETGNNPQNTNYEDKTILFRVDSTAPEINSITGLENKIINATGVTVKYTIFDTISLASVDVYVNGEKVESVSDFGDDFNNYSGEVQLKESSSEQSVRIVATDKAGNVTDTDSSDFTSAYKFNSKVTVSTNVFVRWFANKLLFFGSIAGVLILIGGVSFLIVVLKRRKKKTA